MDKLTKTLQRLESILNTQTCSDTDPIPNICKTANEWIGHGTYVEEDSCSVLVRNYPESPAYRINDFMILFDIFPNTTKYPRTLEYLKRLAIERRQNKTLHMNCWQFVLLCMQISGMIEPDHILRMYQAQNTLPPRDRRIPDLMVTREQRSNKAAAKTGDIIFFTQESGLIWHMGIVCSKEDKMGYIHCLGFDVLFSEFSEYDKSSFCLNPTDVTNNIILATKRITPINLSSMSDINPEQMLLALFSEGGEMHQEYSNELERKWNKYTSTEEYGQYQPEESFTYTLQIMGRGDEYNKEAIIQHHESTYKTKISTQTQQEILSIHGLEELLQNPQTTP